MKSSLWFIFWIIEEQILANLQKTNQKNQYLNI